VSSLSVLDERERLRASIVRFDRTERVVHWVTAALVITLMLTGAAMYAGPVSTLVGRRVLVRDLHVLAGLALPVPIVTALLARRAGAALRADIRELNRFTRKFNLGQRINASFLAASGLVLLATGIMLKWNDPFSDDLRTGATFVHDWFAIGVWVAILGHIAFALRDPIALRGMTRGTVPARWARDMHPRWYRREVAREEPGRRPKLGSGRASTRR
jgi:formate dehydrogenase subunit gamma